MSAKIGGEQLHGSTAGEVCRFSVVVAAVVAVETVPGIVQMDHGIGVHLGDLIDITQGDTRVLFTEVHEQWTIRLFFDVRNDLTSVVHHCRIDR